MQIHRSVNGGMKVKSFNYLFLIVIIPFAVSGCARGYESIKNAGDLDVMLRSSRYPLQKGENKLSIFITDNAKKPVTDATVQIRYYLQSMPGMVPREFNSAAELKGRKYQFAATIPEEGGWKMDVMVSQPGKPVLTATFNIDAR
jgi:hypothetical protein